MQPLDSDSYEPLGLSEKEIALSETAIPKELWAELEDNLNQSSWTPRTIPVGLNSATRDLAKHWKEIVDEPVVRSAAAKDDHYLNRIGIERLQESNLEPEFVADFAKFVTARLAQRMREIRHVQGLLKLELAKFNH